MPNYCDCTLTITGPNRQAVLDKIKGEPWTHEKPEGEPVYFDVEKIVPRPEGLGDKWQDWGYENWGCRNVYPDRQCHWQEADADLISFYTPWSPPLYATQALSAMFPENTFILKDRGHDLPNGATLLRAGKSSEYFVLPSFNGNTGKTATSYEVFLAVLRRTGSLLEALAEVRQVLEETPIEDPEHNDGPNAEPDHDPALDAEIRSLLTHYLITEQQVSKDKALIAKHVAGIGDMDEEQIKTYAERLLEEHYEMVLSNEGEN